MTHHHQEHPTAQEKSFFARYKWFIIAGAALLAIAVLLFGAKIVLFWNFVVGKDTVVKLSADTTYLRLEHGQQGTLRFKASVIANPFCSAYCTTSFVDVSSNTTLDTDAFEMKPGMPFDKEYAVRANQDGEGIDLYRFRLECQSNRTALCQTNENPSTRAIIAAVERAFTEDEARLKNELREKIQDLRGSIEETGSRYLSYNATYPFLYQSSLPEEIHAAQQQIAQSFLSLLKPWQEQRLAETLTRVLATEEAVDRFNQLLSNTRVEEDALIYNLELDSLLQRGQELRQLAATRMPDAELAGQLNSTLYRFNLAVEHFGKDIHLDEKKRIVDSVSFSDGLNSSPARILSSISHTAAVQEAQLSVSYKALCVMTEICFNSTLPPEILNATYFDSNLSCQKIDIFHQQYPDINITALDESFDVLRVKENITIQLLQETPLAYPFAQALLEQINESLMPERCPIVQDEFTITEVMYTRLVLNGSFPYRMNITIPEPEPQCCIWGSCRPCCISDTCKKINYPIVFIHGHAISKETSAEFSLEGFNKLQKRLEDDGYLNVGSITLYTEQDTPPGIWGKTDVPLTMRASYYFDLFKQPENYVVVQTKSESIDTYATRLKEIIDTITYKTGKDKVILIPFSMGGLVTRRYAQLFGNDKVSRLILIGVPNHGITGEIANVCPLVGEELECRDMLADSLFINKLNRGALPDLPITNIIGTGCRMKDGIGDGAVLEESAFLDGAVNVIINGTCRSKVKPLHLDLLDVSRYPEVYDTIKRALKE